MKRSPVLATLTLAALLLAGCSSGDSSESAPAATSGGAAAPSGVADTEAADAGKGGAGQAVSPPAGGSQAVSPAQAATAAGRVAPATSVIRTGELEVVVDDVRKAADEAARLTRGAGGNVESEERSSDDERGGDGTGAAVLRLRVPPESFDATLGGLAGLGEERSRRLGSEDVTGQVVDLDSRMSTQRASVERVRALLSEADTLGEVVQIESELTKRTADLESLEARLDALTGQVELSTITVRLTAKDSPAASPAGPLGFRDGLREGWAALTAVGRALGVTAGAVLPFTPVLLLGGFLLWRGRARRPA
ncbi:MAG: DUF4349 domain-containing protein [Mycobacteriales bacterium]